MIQQKLLSKSIEGLRLDRLELYDEMLDDVHNLHRQITERIINYRDKVKIIDTQIRLLMEEQKNENTTKTRRKSRRKEETKE